MAKRTTLLLDDESQQLLADLVDVHGSQSAAVRGALEVAHAALVRGRKRQAFIAELVAESGEPTAADRAWARRVAVDAAAATAQARQR